MGTQADVIRFLLHPTKAPLLGLNSYTIYAKDGFWSALAGVRLEKSIVRVKDGDVKMTSAAILAASTFRGAGTFRKGTVSGGNPKIFAAFHLSDFGRVFMSTDGIDFTTVSAGVSGEYTASSGQFGDTRFTTAATNDPWFYMQAVTHRFIPDQDYGVLGDRCFIIQHHGNAPRVYSSLYDVFGIHDEISTPQSSNKFNVIPTFPAFLLVNTTAETTFGGAGSVLGTDQGTTPNNYIRIRATNPVLNDIEGIQFTTPMSLGTAAGVLTSRQIVMLVESPTPNIFDKYAILIDDGGAGSAQTIYDPTSSTKNQPPTVTPADAGGKLYWVGFSLDTIDGTTVGAGGINLSVVNRVEFRWAVAGENPAIYDLFIYAICGSGKAPGGRRHCATYFRRKMMCESRALFFDTVTPELVKNLGGPDVISGRIAGGMRIPSIDYRLFNSYKIFYQNPTQAELNKGTDMLVLYGQDVGEKWYSWITSDTIGTFLGTWSFSSGSALGIRTVTDSTYDKKYAYRAPTTDTKPIPNGKAMCYANGRLFVAARPQASLGYSTVYVSDEGYPGRMREASKTINGPTDFDPTSGTTHQLEDEDVMQMVATPGQFQGTSVVSIFTDKAVWQVGRDVNRTERVATIGTLSPMSVVEYEGKIFFMDSNRRVQLVENGEINDITTGVIQGDLEAIPGGSDASISRLYRVSGACWKNRYYLAYGVTGTTNAKVAVYDILRRVWVAVDLPAGADLTSFTVEQLITWEKSGLLGLYAFSSDREFYQYEQPASTANAAITMTTPEFHWDDGDSMWEKIELKRFGIVADDRASSLTISRYYYPGAATPSTSTISLNGSLDRIWDVDGMQTVNDALGRTTKLSVAGSVAGGTNIYEMIVEERKEGCSVL